MRAVLTGEEPDRTPFAPCIYIDHASYCTGHQFDEALADPRLVIQWMLEGNLLYRSDIVRVLPTPPYSWFRQKEVEHREGKLSQIDRRSGRVDGWFDVQGGGTLILAQPPEPVRTAEQAEAIGDMLCLIGGVSCLTLLEGTLDGVHHEARACIRDGGPRYVLGSACAVPRFTPMENMHALARAALRVGH